MAFQVILSKNQIQLPLSKGNISPGDTIEVLLINLDSTYSGATATFSMKKGKANQDLSAVANALPPFIDTSTLSQVFDSPIVNYQQKFYLDPSQTSALDLLSNYILEVEITKTDSTVESWQLLVTTGQDLVGTATPADPAQPFVRFLGSFATAPAGATGDLYYNTTDSTYYFYRTIWEVLGSSLNLDTKEDVVNKKTDFTTIDNIGYPTIEAVENRIIATTTGLRSEFFRITVSDILGYYTMESTPLVDGLQSITTAGVVNNQILATFATPVGFPNLSFIPSGVSKLLVQAKKTAGTRNVALYAEFYKRTAGGVETLLATTSTSIILTGVSGEYLADAVIPSIINLNTTDRLVVKVRAIVTGTGSVPTVAIEIEDNTASRFELPLSSLGYIPQEAIVVSSGAPVTTPSDGSLYLDTLNSRFYVRTGGAWKYTQLI